MKKDNKYNLIQINYD